MSTFGERLRELRKNKNLTQEKLAEQLSVNRDALAKWETDRSYPDVNIIKELATFFEVTTDYLLGRDDDGFEARVAKEIKKYKGLMGEEEEKFLLEMIINYLETVKRKKRS